MTKRTYIIVCVTIIILVLLIVIQLLYLQLKTTENEFILEDKQYELNLDVNEKQNMYIYKPFIEYSKPKEKEIKEVFTYVEGEKLIFHQYENEHGKYIRNIDHENSPALYTNEIESDYIFLYKSQIYRYVESAEAVRLTKLDFNGYSHEELITTIGSHVFWAEAPSLSPSGRYVLYYTNKIIKDSVPATQDALKLIDIETKEEMSFDIINNGASLSLYTYWIDDRYFIYEQLLEDSRRRLYKIDIETETITNTVEINGYSIVENGFLVYRKGNIIQAINLTTWIDYSYDLPKIGIEQFMTVSREGVIIYPYQDKVVVLRPEFEKTAEQYMLPVEGAIYDYSEWIDDNTIIINLVDKSERTSWMLKLDTLAQVKTVD